MGFAPKTIVIDGPTGYWEMAIDEALGDRSASRYGPNIPWGAIRGYWDRDMRLCRQINEKYGTIIWVVAHIAPRTLREIVGYDKNGKPEFQERITGWQVNVPGKAARGFAVPLDEFYLLEAIGNDVGSNPPRVLRTYQYKLHGYQVDCKTRKGVKGPITNPTYEAIVKAKDPAKDNPTLIMVVGEPGVGKTTLAGTSTPPVLFFDLQGGCEEEAKKPQTRVLKPQRLEEVFTTLRTLRDKGELP